MITDGARVVSLQTHLLVCRHIYRSCHRLTLVCFHRPIRWVGSGLNKHWSVALAGSSDQSSTKFEPPCCKALLQESPGRDATVPWAWDDQSCTPSMPNMSSSVPAVHDGKCSILDVVGKLVDSSEPLPERLGAENCAMCVPVRPPLCNVTRVLPMLSTCGSGAQRYEYAESKSCMPTAASQMVRPIGVFREGR
jgi:hypothetical protein